MSVPPGSELVVMVSAPATEVEKSLVADPPKASTTLIVKLEAPGVVGVPVMAPDPEAKPNPAGRAPAETDQVRGAVPPVAVTV